MSNGIPGGLKREANARDSRSRVRKPSIAQPLPQNSTSSEAGISFAPFASSHQSVLGTHLSCFVVLLASRLPQERVVHESHLRLRRQRVASCDVGSAGPRLADKGVERRHEVRAGGNGSGAGSVEDEGEEGIGGALGFEEGGRGGEEEREGGAGNAAESTTISTRRRCERLRGYAQGRIGEKGLNE